MSDPPWPGDHPIPVAGAILDNGEEILLVRPHHLDEFWLISGYLEAWESARDAAIREVEEEVGLVITDPAIVGSYSCRAIDLNMVFIVYSARVDRRKVVLGDEIAEARWCRKDQLPDWPMQSPARLALEDYMALSAP